MAGREASFFDALWKETIIEQSFAVEATANWQTLSSLSCSVFGLSFRSEFRSVIEGADEVASKMLPWREEATLCHNGVVKGPSTPRLSLSPGLDSK